MIALNCSPIAVETRKQPLRARLPSLSVSRRCLAKCLAFLFFASFFGLPAARAQNIGLDSIEVVLFDPLGKSGSEDGFRPVTARVTVRKGALATRDQDFWLVQRLSTLYSRDRTDKVLFKKFTLKAGTSQVDVSFSAQCVGDHFQNEELFIERDGNLNYSLMTQQDFCQSIRSLNWNNRLDDCFNALMIRSASEPQIDSSSITAVDLLESGRVNEAMVGYGFSGNEATEQPPSLLDFDQVLWETLARRLLWLRGDRNYSQSDAADNVSDYASVNDFLGNNRWFSLGTPEQMPDDWAALVNLDLLLVSEQDLAKFSAAQLTAVQRWLAAGGRLCLTNCSIDKSGLGQITERICGPREVDERSLRDPNWMRITEQDFEGKLGKSFVENTFDGSLLDRMPSAVESISLNQCTTRPLGDIAELGKQDFLYFDHLIGRVACTALKVEEFQADDWRRMLLATYGNRKSETVRSTLGSRALAGLPLDDFEVAGVSQPPKLLFLGLITLFALVAGPLAYTVLYRSRRVNFLLVIVPLISLLTTLGLVLYVILADGFQFQTRRLSFTRLDQNAQRAVTTTRHTVFSGTNPRNYTGEESEAFFAGSYQGRDIQQLQYSERGSRLSANWIQARTPHQIATASVQAVTVGLDVNRKDSNGETTVTVTNRLGGPLVGALLRIENEWYEVGPLGPEETATCTKSSPDGFQANIRPVIQEATKKTAPRNWSTPSEILGTNSPESRLIVLLESPELINSQLIQDGQYFAVLKDFPGAGQLKDYAKYQHQLHLIHGNW
ncbi:MAG: hypothetical protein ACKO81_18510 [Planctomycetota bacterium]